MARRPTAAQKREVDALLRKLEPAIAKAFRDAMAAHAANIDTRALISLLNTGRIEDAIQLLRVNQAILFPLSEAIRGSYMAGGAAVATAIPMGARAVFGFDGNHPRAIEWSRINAAEKVTAISDEMIQVSRGIITAGIERNASNQAIARDLVGRKIGRARVGGMIGVNDQQRQQIARARAMLSDPAQINDYFVRDRVTGKLKPRYVTSDRRYDKLVREAIAEGRALTPAELARVTEAHTQKAITARGRTIAENEAHIALSSGRDEGYQQLIDSGAVEGVSVRWQHNLTKDARPDHAAMDGTVIQLGETFNFPDAQMKHPHDPAGGAKHSIGCFAPWTNIARLGIKKAIKYQYSGNLIELSFGGKVPLTVTPNHPILTRRGWVPAGVIAEGEDVFECANFNITAAGPDHHIEDVLSTAEQIYNSAKSCGIACRVSRQVVNFHGYIPDHDVDVVSVKHALGFALDASTQKEIDNSIFAFANVSAGRLLAQRMQAACRGEFASHGCSKSSGGRSSLSLFGSHFGATTSRAFGMVRSIKVKFFKASGHNRSTCSHLARDCQRGVALVEKLGNLWVKCLSGRFGLGDNRCRLAAGSAPVGWGDTKVFKARSDNRLSEFGSPANLRDAFGFGSCGLDQGQERQTLFSPTVRTITGVRKFHYDGPVYNFESTSNVLVSNGIVNHNCNCIAIYRVRLPRD